MQHAENTHQLIELEERLTHLEASVDALTGALLAREREMRNVWLAIDQLKGRLADLVPSVVAAEREPPPPHY